MKLDVLKAITVVFFILIGGLVSCGRSYPGGGFDLPPSLTCTGNPCWLQYALHEKQFDNQPIVEHYAPEEEQDPEFRRSDIEYDRINLPIGALKDLSQPLIAPLEPIFVDPIEEVENVDVPLFGGIDGKYQGVAVHVENNQSVTTVDSRKKASKIDLDNREESAGEVEQLESLSRIESLYNETDGLGKRKVLRQFGYEVFKLNDSNRLSQIELGVSDPVEISLLQKQLMYSAFSGPVNARYVMGPGDEILIRATGGVEINGSFTIDREGTIFLPQVGVIKLANHRVEELQPLIYDALSDRYRDFILETALGKLHSIRIDVVGHVSNPGVHYVGANLTLFEALAFLGGPTKDGSLRNIVVKRAQEPDLHVDLYEVLIHGERVADLPLIEGDIIYIPPIGCTAAINGPVIKGIFELNGRTTLSELISYAGGINAFTVLKTVLLERTVASGYRELQKINFLENGGDFLLQDGDLVDLMQVIGELQNVVEIEGAISRPGVFAFREGMRLSDLIKMGQGFIVNASLEYALLQRQNYQENRYSLTSWDKRGAVSEEVVWVNLKDLLEGNREADIPLSRLDRLKILTLDEVQTLPTVKISGGVRKPGIYQLTNRMTLFDLIMLAGGPTDDAYRGVSSIVRRKEDCTHDDVELIPYCLASVLQKAGDHSVLLKNYDQVKVRQSQTLQVTATIDGHVQFPGTYVLPYGSRISDLFVCAGGLLPQAELRAAIFSRDSVRELQKQRLEELFARTRELFLHSRNKVTRDGHVHESVANQMGLMGLSFLDRNMHRFQTQGRVILDLICDDFVYSPNNMLLENNDVLYVPQRNSAVAVLGRVFSPNAFVWKPHSTVSDYLRNAGGFTEDANPCQVYVVMANGIVRSTRQLGYERMMCFVPGPGDAILVPSREIGRSQRAILQDNLLVLRELLEMGLVGASIPAATRRDSQVILDVGDPEWGRPLTADQLYNTLIDRGILD